MGKSKKPIEIATLDTPTPDAVEPSYRAKFLRVERLVTLLGEGRGRINGVFLSGQPGISKTTSCLKTLATLGYQERKDADDANDAPRQYVLSRGSVSPLGLYMQLFGNRESTPDRTRLVIFDDADAAVMNKDGVNIVKAALDDSGERRVVSFVSSRLPPGIPTSFEFKAKLLVISNLKLTDIDEAIQSRCHCVELRLSRDEIFSFIEHEVLPQPYGATKMHERRYVLWRLKAAMKVSPVQVSVRLYRQILDMWCHDREFFNQHVDALIPRSEELAMIRRLLDYHDTVTSAAKAYATISSKSERTFHLLKAKYRDSL